MTAMVSLAVSSAILWASRCQGNHTLAAGGEHVRNDSAGTLPSSAAAAAVTAAPPRPPPARPGPVRWIAGFTSVRATTGPGRQAAAREPRCCPRPRRPAVAESPIARFHSTVRLVSAS